jgi:hypothetical protein
MKFGRGTSDAMEMIGQYDDRIDGEVATPARLGKHRAQVVDMLRQQPPATFEQGDGEEEGSARDNCANVSGHPSL